MTGAEVTGAEVTGAEVTGAEVTGAEVTAAEVTAAEVKAGAPVTPDGRYLVVRGRLWRRADPGLGAVERAGLVAELMSARRAKQAAMRAGDPAAREAARLRVDAAKIALGERGPVWWTDGAPDLNRHMVRTTPYAGWFEGLPG